MSLKSNNSEDPAQEVELFCGRIQNFLKLYNNIGTKTDNAQLRNELGKMREEIKLLDQSISRKIKTFKTAQNASPDPQFNLMVIGFTKASETWRTIYRESIKREKLTQTSSQVAIDTDPSVIAQKFAKMEGKQYSSKEDALRDYLCDRENEARLIREESQAIAELFQLSAKMMAEQQENLETIDTNLANAEAETNQAVLTLAEAAKLDNERVVYKGAIVGGVMLGAVGFLLGPLGTVVAGSAGVWAGGKIGKVVSQISNSMLDKELFEYHMKRKWIADEAVTHCMHCAATFSFFLRKHHCRACGQVFCYSCCFKLLPFKFNGMESEKMEKVCNKCYNVYWESPDSFN